jgi:GAF domain-containing protein
MLPSACGDIDRAPTRAGQDVSAATGTPPNAHETVADCIVGRANAAIAGTGETAISVLRNHRPVSIAASGELYAGISAIQRDLADSPALRVLLQGSAVLSNDLRLERRWPEFTRRTTADTAVLSMLIVPLRRDRRVVAALSVHATKPLTFDEAAIQAAGCSLTAQVSAWPPRAIETERPTWRSRCATAATSAWRRAS